MRGQMHFAMVALGLVVAVIALVIAQTVITNSAGNFTGVSSTVFTNIMPIALVGLLVFIAYATIRGK
jgi:hypothetical protein